MSTSMGRYCDGGSTIIDAIGPERDFVLAICSLAPALSCPGLARRMIKRPDVEDSNGEGCKQWDPPFFLCNEDFVLEEVIGEIMRVDA